MQAFDLLAGRSGVEYGARCAGHCGEQHGDGEIALRDESIRRGAEHGADGCVGALRNRGDERFGVQFRGDGVKSRKCIFAKHLGVNVGVNVGVNERRDHVGEGLVAKGAASLVAKGIDARFVEIDLDGPETIFAAATWVESEFERLDSLVNNAGIAVQGDGPPSVANLESVERTVRTNFLGSLRVT